MRKAAPVNVNSCSVCTAACADQLKMNCTALTAFGAQLWKQLINVNLELRTLRLSDSDSQNFWQLLASFTLQHT